MQVTYGLRRATLLYGDNIALLDSNTSWTWNEFSGRVERMAGAIQALGLGADDTIGILMLNHYRYCELNYAVPWAGGIIVPLNTRLAPPELIFQLNDCKAKALFVDDNFVPMLKEFEGKLETVETIVYVGDGDAPEKAHDYEAILSAAEAVPDAGRSGLDTMSIFYTGGTTGRSKGVVLSHGNVVSNSLNAIVGLQFDPSDIYLHVAPMFHLADAGTTFAITMGGGTHSFIPGFEPEATLKAIQDFKVTRVILVPTMINMVINHPAVKDYDLSSLRTVIYGASPIPEAVLKKALKTLPCQFIQGYGMTESSQMISLLPHEDHLHPEGSEKSKRLRSAGVPLTTTEVRVVDENDKEVPRGTIGEICFRGPNVMQGYLNMPEATAEAIRDGWMHSGDVGYMDEDGYIYLVDRAKDMIVSGGENIYSVEVEAALYTHESVLEAAVIGIPHDDWGEAVHAVVVPKPGENPTEAELIEHCRGNIAGYKIPKSVTFQSEALPKSGAGKILKRELRESFWAGRDRQIN